VRFCEKRKRGDCHWKCCERAIETEIFDQEIEYHLQQEFANV
jgi:hypothetical protein